MSHAWSSDQSNDAPDSNIFGNELDNDIDNSLSSRDDKSVNFKRSKTSSINRNFPQYNYDSSLRKMLETSIEPTILNEYLSLDIKGRSLPIGFAEYVDNTIQPLNYNFYYIPGWRIAIPRSIPMDQVDSILNSIFYQGPEPSGFVRIGDTLVPAMLGPGDRMALAQTVDFY